MDEIRALPTRELPGIVAPTASIFAPLLARAADTIKSVPKQTFSYGPNPRQQLDVFVPPQNAHASTPNGRQKVLVFVYGGGLVSGDRTLGMPALGGLVYSNVAAYFALNHGYTVVIPDYRLVGGQHGEVRFPDGGQDIALTVEWIRTNTSKLSGSGQDGGVDLYILANSAGGIHTSTFLFQDDFEDVRSKVLFPTSQQNATLKGVALLGVPFALEDLAGPILQAVTAYYGGGHIEKSPLGLLKSLGERHGLQADFIRARMRLLVVNSEFDPEKLCLEPRARFLAEWRKQFGEGALLEEQMLEGHNHLSPPLALGTGREDGEAWGARIASWIDAEK